MTVEPDGSSFVWVVDPQRNSVSARKVTPLNLSGGDVAISGELQAGEVVVTAGVSFLREGMQVNPIHANAE